MAPRKIVLLAGLSASGKTSLGERLKASRPDDWIHFDGDTWMAGGDPVQESGHVVVGLSGDPKDGQTLQQQQQQHKYTPLATLKDALSQAQTDGYGRLFKNQPPDYAAFERFYGLMCDDVAKVVNEQEDDHANKSIVLTHSVYCAQTRSFIKQRLEDSTGVDEVQVIVIHCSREKLVDRRTNRAKKVALEDANAESFELYLQSAMDAHGLGITEPTEEAFRAYVATWNIGFEEATDSEMVLDVTDGKGLDEMYACFAAMVGVKSRWTEDLRLAAGAQWQRVVTHRFSDELSAGTIDRQVLKRYLIQDHRFLDSFSVLLASTAAQIPTLADRIPACQFLAVITGPENTYFERAFDALGVSEVERKAIPDAPVTTQFCNLMKNVAFHGSLAEKLAVLVVCEWSYFSWGKRVENKTVRVDFVCYEWVDLHSGPDFERVVDYLRRLLDQEGDRMKREGSALDMEACQQRFLQTVGLEEDFFEYCQP